MADEAVLCALCGAEQQTDPAVVCRPCAGTARSRILGAVALLPLLDDNAARLSRLDRRGGARPLDEDADLPLTAAQAPAPDVTALEAASAVRDVVGRWAHAVRRASLADCSHSSCVELYGPVCARRHRWAQGLVEVARDSFTFLADRTAILRHLRGADEACADLEQATRRGWALVDATPPLGWFVGECLAELEDDEHPGTTFACARKLYARVDEQRVRCPGCRTWHDVAPRREHLLLQAREQSLAAVDLARLLVTLGYADSVERAAARVRKWGSRGLLVVRGHTEADEQGRGAGRPRYRLGDVLDRLKAEAYGEVRAS